MDKELNELKNDEDFYEMSYSALEELGLPSDEIEMLIDDFLEGY